MVSQKTYSLSSSDISIFVRKCLHLIAKVTIYDSVLIITFDKTKKVLRSIKNINKQKDCKVIKNNCSIKKWIPLTFIRKVLGTLNIQFNKKCMVINQETYSVSSFDISTLTRKS